MTSEPRIGEPSRHILLGLVLLVGLALLVIVFTAPPNLLQNNEDRMAAYVQDVVENGHWICQRDGMGRIASKPPLYAWISSLAAHCSGQISPLTLYFPSMMATLALGGIIFSSGRAWLGWRAGLLGALVYLLSHVAEKQMVTSRYDGLLALTSTLAALAAFRAWNLGRGWIWFWLAAAAGTMTKGPLGLLLPAGGLLAAWWEKRTVGPAPIRGSHWTGLTLFLVITAGWFALAWWKMGQELINKMIFAELVTHAVVSDDGALPGSGFFKPLLAFLSDFAPWSLFACLGLWRAWKKPASDLTERRFERFLCCWFLVDLLIFSVAAHQRSRLILPIVPPAALLAGHELARLTARWRPALLARVAAVTILIGLLAIGVYDHGLSRSKKAVRETEGLRQLALQVREKVGVRFPFTHVSSPFVFQFHSQTHWPLSPISQAASLVQGNEPFFCVLPDIAALQKQPGVDMGRLHVLARWPASGKPVLQIVSNHPRLEWTERVACGIGPIRIEMEGMRLSRVRREEFAFSNPSGKGWLRFSNDSDRNRRVRVRLMSPGIETVRERSLGPGESWLVDAGKD